MATQSGVPNPAVDNTVAQNFTANAAAAGMTAGINHSATAAQAGGDDMWSFIDAGLQVPVERRAGGADVRTMMGLFAKITAESPAAGGFVVDSLAIDNTVETGWHYSALVVTVAQKATNTVAFYPLLLESTSKGALAAETRDVGMNTYQVMHVPSDGLDTEYSRRIVKAVAEAFPDFKLLNANGMVVPDTVAADNEDQAREILYNATRACVTAVVESNPAFTDVNLTRRLDNTFQNVNIVISKNDALDIVGMPVRQDVVVSLTARQKQEQQTQQNQQNAPRSINSVGGSESLVGTVSGFYDISFAPQSATPGGQFMQNPLDRTRQFVPRYIVTAINQPKLATLASTLLMLYTTTCLTDVSTWQSVFFQRMKDHRLEVGGKDKGVDPTDIGILNLVSNVLNVPADKSAEPYDLKSNAVTAGEFVNYMYQVFVPDCSIAIDVPRCGPQSWYLNVLSGAAQGNAGAMHEIVRAADKLTGNRFSAHFFAGTQVGQAPILDVGGFFSETNNTVHNGYFNKQTTDGVEKRDLRAVDYLYVLNRYGKMDKTALDWATTFLIDRTNPFQRMARRKEIIEATVGGKVVFTGFSERHTFSKRFITALLLSCVEAGLKPNFQYNNPLAGANANLAKPGYLDNGLLGAGMLNQGFSTGGGQGTTGGALFNPTQTRWQV